jgi:hypothetical protein
MPLVSATVVITKSCETIYCYLQGRYQGQQYRAASMATKGYVPELQCLSSEPNRKLVFQVAGRDPLLGSVGGWKWEYELNPIGSEATQVLIRYSWGLGMSLLGGGTVHHQASNELVETVMALEALAFPQN